MMVSGLFLLLSTFLLLASFVTSALPASVVSIESAIRNRQYYEAVLPVLAAAIHQVSLQAAVEEASTIGEPADAGDWRAHGAGCTAQLGV
jgi:Na+-transporting methylmalonyl-CoA/oxaloacetate decarboxylase gamma subunit